MNLRPILLYNHFLRYFQICPVGEKCQFKGETCIRQHPKINFQPPIKPLTKANYPTSVCLTGHAYERIMSNPLYRQFKPTPKLMSPYSENY